MGTFKDLTGQKFGDLTVIRYAGRYLGDGQATWLCTCKCGRAQEVRGWRLRSGKITHCSDRSHRKRHPYKDLKGHRYGTLEVLELLGIDRDRNCVWRCKCVCGKVEEVSSSRLLHTQNPNCGCGGRYPKNLTGMVFGRLTVLGLSVEGDYRKKWKCLCSCGKPAEISRQCLLFGRTKSCGCLHSEVAAQNVKIVAERAAALHRSNFPNQKICTKCRSDLPLSEFANDKSTSDGKTPWCKPCRRKISVEWSRDNPDKLWASAQKPSNRLRSMWRHTRDRAARRGIPFNISVEDLHIPEVCPVLGIPIIIGERGGVDTSPSIDRIIPSKGYTRGNVAIISHKANVVKSFGTAQEHRMIAKWMDQVLGEPPNG